MFRQIFAPRQFRLIARSYVLTFDISTFLDHFLNGFHRFLPLWHSQIGIPPKNAPFFFRFTLPTLALQYCLVCLLSPRSVMSTSRPSPTPLHLTLDEQSFQGLLSAAFTIQEHNDRRQQEQNNRPHQEQIHRPEEPLDFAQEHNEPQSSQQTQPTEPPTEEQSTARLAPDVTVVCRHCGAPKPPEAAHCQSCGLDQFRPGERLQRNWASMWLWSPEQGLWPERSPETDEAVQKIRQGLPKRFPQLGAKSPLRPRSAPDLPERAFPPNQTTGETAAYAEAVSERERALDRTVSRNSRLDLSATEASALGELTSGREAAPQDSNRVPHPFASPVVDDFFPANATSDSWESDATDYPSLAPNRDPGNDPSSDPIGDSSANDSAPKSLMQRLAELSVTIRFHRADLYLGVALFVAVLALLWPAAAAPRRPALGPWERALITLGIADAPQPVVHLQGDPSIQVWVDTHSALYYCPGEEQ